MRDRRNQRTGRCQGITRRSFLVDTGMGFTGLALSSLLARDGSTRRAHAAEPHSAIGPHSVVGPHFEPRAKSVIWIFLCGGVSHVESFDIKPALNQYAGKSIDDTPLKGALDPQRALANLVDINPSHGNRKVLFPLQTGYRRYGRSGLEV